MTYTPGGYIIEHGDKMEKEKKCKVKVHRTPEEVSKCVNRLNRIEGQIHGISKMITEDRHCDEILIQISAVSNALRGLGEELLLNHMKKCMIEDIKDNKLETIDEIMELCRRLMK